jgi:hypothetical protein
MTTNLRRELVRFSLDWDWWSFWAGVLAAGLTVGAAFAGLVAWYASIRTSEAADARQKALELKVAEQQERAAKAEKALLDLQAAMGPRWLNFIQEDEESRVRKIAELKKYGGTTVAIAWVPDLEAQRLADQIAAGLRTNGWIVEMRTANTARVPVGLVIEGVVVTTLEKAPNFSKPGDPPNTGIKMFPFSRAAAAGQALVAVWEPTLGPPFGPPLFGIHWEPSYPLDSDVPSMWLHGGFQFPKDGVLVIIGPKPTGHIRLPVTPAK